MAKVSYLKKMDDIAVSFSTRISLSSRQLIDEVVAQDDISIREVIEQALVAHWGNRAATQETVHRYPAAGNE